VNETASTIGAFLTGRAATHGDAEVVVTPTARLTYADLDAQSRDLAVHLIAHGVGKGSRVGILCPNGVQWVVSWAAATRIGGVAVLLSTYATASELRRLVRHADVALLLTAPGGGRHDYLPRLAAASPSLDEQTGTLFLPELPSLRAVWSWNVAEPRWVTEVGALEPSVGAAAVRPGIEADVRPSDAATIIYTSGSTSLPKGIVHGHGALLRHSARTMKRSRPVGPGDRVYSPNPLFWIGGVAATLLGAMHGGATLLTEPVFEPGRTLDFIERERMTLFLGQPHAWNALREHPSFASRDLASQTGRTGRALAMTETCSAHAATDPRDPPPAEVNCFGRPIEGIEHRVIDPETGAELGEWEVGELCVRGPDLMLGMVKRERFEVFDAEGWYHTGDAGALGNGQVYFHGRRDDRIRTRGMNVVPRELEVELQTLDGVAMAVVVGVANADHGEDVAAAIVSAPGEPLTLEALEEQMRARLSAYKVPTRLVVLDPDAVPLTATGKIDRRRVASLLSETATEAINWSR
jgi:acyl-CoA synthetase (AMP-forming)/AMP-acid ligase II